MPLLMKTPSALPLPPEASGIVPAGTAAGFRVGAGQLLGVRDVEGGQPVGLFAFCQAMPDTFLSPHHTRVFSNSFLLRLGMRLVTNKRRPALVLGVSAPHLKHDLLMPLATAPEAVPDAPRAAFEAMGLAPVKVADPINIFLDVTVNRDGSLTPNGVSSRPGDAVVFRAVMDLFVVLHSAPADPALWSRPTAGPVEYLVGNDARAAISWAATRS